MVSDSPLLPCLVDLQTAKVWTYRDLMGDLRGSDFEIQGPDSAEPLYRALLQILKALQDVPVNQDAGDTSWETENLNLLTWRNRFLASVKTIPIVTSGSSGQPKRVWHTMHSLTRGIKLDEKHRSDVWGLTYPIDHLAGLQVLFQALLNFNPIVNLYRAMPAAVHAAIDEHRITHLSCTPTFLRMILAEDCIHPSLQRLTSGGERLDASLLSLISRMFPNAKLTNIYAATETGTLLVSHNDCFVVPSELRDRMRIVDGELWLDESLKVSGERREASGEKKHESDERRAASGEKRHESGHRRAASGEKSAGTGEGQWAEGEGLERDKLRAIEVQRDNLPLAARHSLPDTCNSPLASNNSQRFWPTGDLVEVLSEQPLMIRFVGRKHEWFNVAGFRVDPVRLETLACGHPQIAQARFFAVPNSVTENIVGCELVLRTRSENDQWNVDDWKNWFSAQVERFEAPRLIRVLDSIETTASGKLKRE